MLTKYTFLFPFLSFHIWKLSDSIGHLLPITNELERIAGGRSGRLGSSNVPLPLFPQIRAGQNGGGNPGPIERRVGIHGADQDLQL